MKKLKLLIQKLQLQIRIAEIQLAIKKLLLRIAGKKKGFEAFAKAIGKRESGNNYKIVNPYGYMGAYQFGMARLSDLGYTERKAGTTGYSNYVFQWKRGYSKDWFLNNPDVQDRIFKQHVRNLIRSIKQSYSQYFGKRINGIKITLSGCVAFSHLSGFGGLGRFLNGRGESSDAYGTKGSSYLAKFSDYDLSKVA